MGPALVVMARPVTLRVDRPQGGLTRGDCADFHKKVFVPNNMIMVLVGDFDADEMLGEVKRLTAGWKKADLPRTWDDLVSAGQWGMGNLALTNNPSSWLLGLWGQFGEAWGTNFTSALFEKLQPQRRKEGLTALTALAVAGDFHASLPSPEWVAKRYVAKGAPLGYHCPDPVPITLSQIAMLQKSPHANAARLFINWMVSREGQILQNAISFDVPVHKALQLPQFVPFVDTIDGKKKSIRDDELLHSDLNRKMTEQWDRYWNAASTTKKP